MNARSVALALVSMLALTWIPSRAAWGEAQLAAPGPGTAHWQVSLLKGTGSTGPAHDLERSMRAEHFDARMGGWWGPPVDYPVSHAGSGLLLTVRVPRGRNEWGVHLGSSTTGETHGLREPYYLVEIRHEVQMLALTLARPVAERWSVGAGPALYLLSGVQKMEGRATERTNAARVGLLLDARLRLPARSRWYCDLALQARLAGRAKVGPFTASVATEDRVALPATSPRFDHVFVAIGIGRQQ